MRRARAGGSTASGSGATLFGLFVLFGLAFVFHGVLDVSRAQMLVDIGRAFGDKLSPLSDTTNLAPAAAGADLFAHIRHMARTTTPALLTTNRMDAIRPWFSAVGKPSLAYTIQTRGDN